MVWYGNNANTHYWDTYTVPGNYRNAYGNFIFRYTNSFTTKNILSLYGDGAGVLGGSLYEASDRRFKKNIAPLKGLLARLIHLHGYTYNWVDETKDKSQQIGLPKKWRANFRNW